VRSSWSQQRILHRVAVSLSFALLSFSFAASGQLSKTAKSSQPAKADEAKGPEDPLGRTNPRGTVLGFLSAAYNQKYDTATQYLNTHARENEARVLAQQLFFVLDRRLPARLNQLSNDPLGSLLNPTDPKRELIGSVVTDTGSVDIYLERVDRPVGDPIWLFSRDTLANIPDLYHEINATTVESLVPDFLLKKYFKVTLFGWAYFFVLLPLLYLVLSLVNRLVSAALNYALRNWVRRQTIQELTVLPHPLRLVIVAITIYATLHEFSLSLLARQAGSTVALLLLIVAFVWAMFLINARGEAFLKRRMERRGRLSSTAVLRPARGVMNFFVIIVGFIFLLHKLGINPSTALAGLGVGGIAVALAAQKTLENVIGGASLIMDGAVRVGDFFKMGDVTGTIEVIGLRSTRVRTMDRTIVTIPNGQMATMMLENFSARDRFWLRHLIGVEYDTTPAALNSLLADVRSLLEQDPRVLRETTRVRFLRFAASSLELEVFAYLAARDWNHFLEIQEELLIKIRQLVGSAGVEFAFPSQTMYVKSEVGMDGGLLQPAPHGAIAEKEAGHEMQNR
jgi:MscS family membrane protein